MKKMLVLALVLAVAGLANAGLQLKVDGANVSSGFNGLGNQLAVYVDYTGVDYYLAIVADKAAVFSTTVDAGLPDLAGVAADSAAGAITGVPQGFDGPVWTIASSTGAAKPLALLLTATAGAKPVIFQVFETDGSAAGQMLATVTLIPEPMTMVLLGLGGLFLRKKK